MPTAPRRVFLLSPANAGGERARLVLNANARFDLAERLRTGDVSLGEVFSFVSGLYFRGKLAYARAFAAPPRGVPGAVVITGGYGLVPPDTPVSLAQLLEIAAVPIDAGRRAYREPLERDARLLLEACGRRCSFVLLGSIATQKYVEPLVSVFGERLLFPIDFVGRGDMSRGGLLLRCARAGIELEYAPVAGSIRHGPRPPRLPRIRPGIEPPVALDRPLSPHPVATSPPATPRSRKKSPGLPRT
ncbi:MAG TPA: hypothetical protein VFD92_08625 [Candidatus Binatia bacterium]|nr:hypothetical protein [Candidatus Binatia bacterium]